MREVFSNRSTFEGKMDDVAFKTGSTLEKNTNDDSLLKQGLLLKERYMTALF